MMLLCIQSILENCVKFRRFSDILYYFYCKIVGHEIADYIDILFGVLKYIWFDEIYFVLRFMIYICKSMLNKSSLSVKL